MQVDCYNKCKLGAGCIAMSARGRVLRCVSCTAMSASWVQVYCYECKRAVCALCCAVEHAEHDYCQLGEPPSQTHEERPPTGTCMRGHVYMCMVVFKIILCISRTYIKHSAVHWMEFV